MIAKNQAVSVSGIPNSRSIAIDAFAADLRRLAQES